MNSSEKHAAYVAKFNNPNAGITTLAEAAKVINSGKENELRDEAVNFLLNAIAYHLSTKQTADEDKKS